MEAATDKGTQALLDTRLLKVLLVDDESTDRIPVERILRTCSSPVEFVIESVVRLSEAIKNLSEKQYDVVLLDLELPDCCGIEILRQVVKVAPDIPVVVLTERDDEQTGFSALEDGATDYLVKDLPLDVVLVRTIIYALQRKKIQMQSLKLMHDNNERMKELNCLYGISNIVETLGISLEEMLEKTVRLIPAGWQYPDIACARIIFEGREYKTDNFKPSKWTQSADITLQGQKVGTVEVSYMEQRPQSDEGPFLEEKRDLIDAIAERLGKMTDRFKAEETLVFSNIILRTQQESSIDGILVVDEKGGILSFNQRFVDMWGIPLDVIESKSDERALQSVMDKLATPEEFICKVKHLYEVREEISRDEVVLKDGRTFDRYSAPMLGAERKYYGRVWYFCDITERKQSEGTLREKSAILVKVINSVPDFIFVKDTRLRDIICNETYASAVGKKPEEMIGHTDIENGWDPELVYGNPAKGIRGFENDDRDALSGKMIHNPYDPANTPKGVLIFDTYKMPLCGKDGEIIGMLGIARDITERFKAEEKINNSQALLHRIINLLPIRVFWKDKNLRYLGCNEIFAKDAGKNNTEDLVGSDDFQTNWKEQAESYRDDDQSVIKSGKPKLNFEEFQTTPKGDRICLKTSKVPLIDSQGNTIGILGTYEDITERKRAEEALRESERKYRELVMLANSIILRWTRDGRITFLNEFGQRFFGYTEAEICGRHVVGTIVPACDSSGRNLPLLMDEICANPAAFEQNINENMRRNGEHVWIAWTNKIVLDSQGQVAEILSIGVDITVSKKAEDTLRESERKMHTIFDQTFQFIGLMTIDGTLIEANRALLKFSDIEASSVLNKPFWLGPWWSHSPQLQEKLRQSVGKAALGEFIRFEATHVAKDGILHYVDFSLKPVQDETGKVIFLIPEGRDITEFKNKKKRNFF